MAVIVRDVDKAAAFYRGVFGLAELERLTARISQHRGAWFRVGALELHLQERADADTSKSEQHFALYTRGLDAIAERVPRFGGRVEQAKLIEGVSKRCFAFDPDGNRIELLEK